MARRKLMVGIILMIVALIFLGPVYTQVLQGVVVKGQVLDVKSEPVPGVTIRIYRGTSKVAEDSTKGDGKYEISFARGRAISVRYDRTNWEPAFVSGLSGEHSHEINKVLVQSGSGQLSFATGFDVLEAYQRVYYLDRAGGVPISHLKGRYAVGLGQVRVPEILKGKLHETASLYALDWPVKQPPER